MNERSLAWQCALMSLHFFMLRYSSQLSILQILQCFMLKHLKEATVSFVDIWRSSGHTYFCFPKTSIMFYLKSNTITKYVRCSLLEHTKNIYIINRNL